MRGSGSAHGQDREICLTLCEHLLEQIPGARAAALRRRALRRASGIWENLKFIVSLLICSALLFFWLLGEIGTVVSVVVVVGLWVVSVMAYVMLHRRRRRRRQREVRSDELDEEAQNQIYQSVSQINMVSEQLSPWSIDPVTIEFQTLAQLEDEVITLLEEVKISLSGKLDSAGGCDMG